MACKQTLVVALCIVAFAFAVEAASAQSEQWAEFPFNL
jgi:hypothetical protein